MIKDVYTWVDDACSVHPNIKVQNSGTMSMGWVTLHCKLSKQELNKKSFTEVELVKTSSYVPYNIWFRMFQDQQGYKFLNNVLYQDNYSTIKIQLKACIYYKLLC